MHCYYKGPKWLQSDLISTLTKPQKLHTLCFHKKLLSILIWEEEAYIVLQTQFVDLCDVLCIQNYERCITAKYYHIYFPLFFFYLSGPSYDTLPINITLLLYVYYTHIICAYNFMNDGCNWGKMVAIIGSKTTFSSIMYDSC